MTSVQDSAADLRFPIGKFQRPPKLDPDAGARAIEVVATKPTRLREAVRGVTAHPIETPDPAWRVDR